VSSFVTLCAFYSFIVWLLLLLLLLRCRLLLLLLRLPPAVLVEVLVIFDLPEFTQETSTLCVSILLCFFPNIVAQCDRSRYGSPFEGSFFAAAPVIQGRAIIGPISESEINTLSPIME
jgi:hypothetical protein